MKFLEYAPLDSINNFLGHVNLGDCVLKGKMEAYSCKHAGMDRKLSLSLEQEILDYLAQSLESSPPSPANLLSNRTSRKTLIYLVLTLSHMYPDYDFSTDSTWQPTTVSSLVQMGMVSMVGQTVVKTVTPYGVESSSLSIPYHVFLLHRIRFSAVQTHDFLREEGWDSFKQMFETYMLEAAKEWSLINQGNSLLECMLGTIDEVVKLSECEVYSYSPDIEGDPFLQRGAVWSVNFFFYNKKLKRILTFRCGCLSKLNMEDWIADEATSGCPGDSDSSGLFYDMDM